MQVFVIFGKSIFDGEEIREMFLNFDDAIRYVVETKFKDRERFEDFSNEELNSHAQEFVYEMTVNESFTQAMIG